MQASVLQVYLTTQVDGVILCFDLNNLKSLESLPRYMSIVQTMMGRHRQAQRSDEEVERVLRGQVHEQAAQGKRGPQVMVVGCKKDLVDKNRAQYLMINTKVLKMLKVLDPDNLVMYTETGLINHQAQRMQVSQDDLRVFIQKVYGNEIRLEQHMNNEFENEITDSNSSSSSSTQGGAGTGLMGTLLGGGSSVLRSLFFKGNKSSATLPM